MLFISKQAGVFANSSQCPCYRFLYFPVKFDISPLALIIIYNIIAVIYRIKILFTECFIYKVY